MSWSLTTGPIPHTHLSEGVERARASAQWFGDDSPEVEEQLQVAAEAAEHLLSAVGFGKPDGLVVVTLSGHANPDHEPRSGYANDAVTVSVASVSERAPSSGAEASMVRAYRDAAGPTVAGDGSGRPLRAID